LGAIVRSDGEVVPMRFFIREDQTILVTDLWGGHPTEAQLDQEGSRWARGWNTRAAKVLEALVALDSSR
jgi:hypothetical protein